MHGRASVLALGEHGGPQSRLAERAREMGFAVVRAKTPQAAIELARERGYRFRSVLVGQHGLSSLDLQAALELVRGHAGTPDMKFIATGPEPLTGERAALHDAGVTRALWDPVGDNALRFALNDSLSASKSAPAFPRAHPRAPTEWQARVFHAGRTKLASVYSVSSDGAYLGTSRPSMKGATVAIELPIPGGPCEVTGSVVYTSVPGNVARTRLPHGMAISFTGATQEARQAIAETVSQWTRYSQI